MWHCCACYRAVIYFLVVGIVATQANNDGSSPEEICPCQVEDSCQAPRHIFGRDPLDIQKFGLISPCRTNGEMPCCPQEPPPPKEVKLTPKDFEGFSPAELAELGLVNNTIGSATLPLAPQTALFNEIPPGWREPVDLRQPGAASLAPAGATVPVPRENTQSAWEQPNKAGQPQWPSQPPASVSTNRPSSQWSSQPPATVPANRPSNEMQPRPTYQPAPAYRPTPQLPAYRQMAQAPSYMPMPQSSVYRPMPQTHAYMPMLQQAAYRQMPQPPAYRPMPQPPAYMPMPHQPAYRPMPQPPTYRPNFTPMHQPHPQYPHPAYQPPYMPPPPPYQQRPAY